MFQAGQAYVALSRLTSLKGLHIIELCPKRIYYDPKVLEEYSKLLDKCKKFD